MTKLSSQNYIRISYITVGSGNNNNNPQIKNVEFGSAHILLGSRFVHLQHLYRCMDISCGDIVNRHNHETLKSKTVKLVVDFYLVKIRTD